MEQSKINRIIEIAKTAPNYHYWDSTFGTADTWGGSIAWGYAITYKPQEDVFCWEDTEDVGTGFNAIEIFKLSEAEVIEKLRKLNN